MLPDFSSGSLARQFRLEPKSLTQHKLESNMQVFQCCCASWEGEEFQSQPWN